MKKIWILLSLMGLMSCGQEGMPWNPEVIKVQKVAPAQAEYYSYEFKGSNCTTGLQEFATLKAACSGLLNDELNNHCQENKRIQLYNTNC